MKLVCKVSWECHLSPALSLLGKVISVLSALPGPDPPVSVASLASSDPLGLRTPAGHHPEPPAGEAVPGPAAEDGPAAGPLQGLPGAAASPGQEEGSAGYPGACQGHGCQAELAAAESQCRWSLPS